MNNLKLVIALAFILLSCTRIGEKQPLLKDEINGVVVKIVDGDTFDCLTV